MRIKFISIFLLLLVFSQIAVSFTGKSNSIVRKPDVISFTISETADQFIQNSNKVNKRFSLRTFEFFSNELDKSLKIDKEKIQFCYYNRILPQELTQAKIFSTFFTSYFSSEV
ncbi:hypothetical protein ASZ90_004364 [hydrocarbon metagenome]|uniref:Uncharacterized protein n=1 Tax=hydrocarbon metagenome TaxID=938273 RepID=A0A0W8FYA1_9ZZZZ